NAQYPNAQYPNAQYPNAQYPNAQYPNAQYPNAQYPNAQYPNAPHSGQLHPGAIYGMQMPPPPASLTGQLRWSEVDEIPSQYKIGAARRRWFTYIVSGLIAVSVAAGVTFLVIRLSRDATPTTGSVHVVSVPTGADVWFDGTLMGDRTPLTIEPVPIGTRHKIEVSLRHYQRYTEEVSIPKAGGTVQMLAQLTSLTGKIAINTTPGGAQIWINGQPRGMTPTTLSGIDIDSTPSIELMHKDFGKYLVPLKWDAAGVAYVDYKFSH
ncbi:MAG TPA: PEGA domain-containing protein, partial [Kofleriaceae bacterium]|nr:PEGA domain-containing protein [Kofleriaceae bacterium]